MDREEICRLMNKAGAKKAPFFFMVNYELTDGVFIENPMEQTELLFCFKGIGNTDAQKTVPGQMQFRSFITDYASYKRKFDYVLNELRSGSVNLVNLTVKTEIETNVSFESIFHLSNSPYKVCLPRKFVCFSPERFVKIEHGMISTNPMKGTIDASIPDATFTILHDPKEIAEHNLMVEYSVSELAGVAKDVTVERFRYIDCIHTGNKNLLQVSSEITGKLAGDYLHNLGSILFELLPAGSISGVPKHKAMKVIQQAEGEERGYYTGIAGYFDGNMLDTAVLIRFIEQTGLHQYYRSGGGITAQSDCFREFMETQDKVYLPFLLQ